MNIILLSGGSGKRLWPLSNDIRSKQFIKIFRREDGEYESMVQRVYRQIKAAAPDANVTVATSKTQVSALHNQLGADIGISVEPSRRDTFPAIVLAAAYLADVRGIDPAEPVIVCPVDPYVNEDYFDALKALEKQVRTGQANLVLMGIAPTYPSEKYGYIVPETCEKTSGVKAFKEKPDSAAARAYIEQGALWNGGVFACRLRYLLEKGREFLDFKGHKDLYERYEEMPKISFDYAVVEREPSIQVVRFSGEWKDLGTWNTLTEAMEEEAIGKVILGDECRNVHVINELSVPVLITGVSDVIVSAGQEGILISGKDASSYIKPYVDRINQPVMFAEKSWGTYTVIDVQPGSMTVKVSLKAGEHMSYHMHNLRDEVWTVVSGEGRAVMNGRERILRAGDVITIAAGCKHTVQAITALNMVEVQMGQEISVSDKIKFDLES